jgi:sRNA-binding carbon storage regulator CsrA
MLIITRKPGQTVQISLNPAVDPMTPVGEIFADGPIEVVVTRIASASMRVGLRASPLLLILRGELCGFAAPPLTSTVHACAELVEP